MSAAYREPVQTAVESEDLELAFMRATADESLRVVRAETEPAVSLATVIYFAR